MQFFLHNCETVYDAHQFDINYKILSDSVLEKDLDCFAERFLCSPLPTGKALLL